MAVNLSAGRAHGADLPGQSVILVDWCYALDELRASADGQAERMPDPRPSYDGCLRKLWFDGFLLKRLRRDDNNQELILQSFDEVGWPELLDDPLWPADGVEPRKRLKDTIYALNRSIEKQADRRAAYWARFHVDNRGTAIRWEPVEAAAAQAAPRVWRPDTRIVDSEWRPRRCK